MKIVAQIGEMNARVRQFARYDEHEAIVNARGDVALKLARVLIAAGYDPTSEYETARGERMGLRYRSLGEAAKLTVKETRLGSRIVKHIPFNRDDIE